MESLGMRMQEAVYEGLPNNKILIMEVNLESHQLLEVTQRLS